MKIQITALGRGGCTDFVAQPHRLHLGGQGAEGVDALDFELPEAWAGKNVALYIQHQDGTRLAPVLLSAAGSVPVDRRFTGAEEGRWMLAATDSQGYAAYTQPGSYDVYPTLSLEGEETEPSQSLYEQFIAQVMDSARLAQAAADDAAQAGADAAAAVGQAQAAAQTAGTKSEAAAASAARAEEAARRAEGYAPEGGDVLSVNGKGGAVWLDAQDVEALPRPAAAAPGQLLRVLSADPVTGQVTTEAVAETALTSFVRRTDKPTAEAAGPVKLAEGGGLTLTAAGVLETDPATEPQLDAMTEEHAPLTPARLPYGVKKALAGSWPGVSWSGEEQSAACSALGAAAASALEALVQRVTALEKGQSGQPSWAGAPVGSVIYFAGSAAPEGYLVCDGSLVNRRTYAALFAVIGTTYGTGNGSTTFALPDLRDRVAWGSTDPGTALESGLPNITGQVYALYTMQPWDNGAFSNYTIMSSYRSGFEGEYSGGVFDEDVVSFIEHNFSAKASSPIYGKSEIVQPPALTLLPCIKY